jgi:hypothetical protein
MKLEMMLTNRMCYRGGFDKAGWVMPICSLDGDSHLSDSLSDFVDLVVEFRIEFFEYSVSRHPEWI